MFFLKKSLLLTKHAFIWSKVKQKQNHFEILFSIWMYFKMQSIPVISKLNLLQHHYSSHMILQKSL